MSVHGGVFVALVIFTYSFSSFGILRMLWRPAHCVVNEDDNIQLHARNVFVSANYTLYMFVR